MSASVMPSNGVKTSSKRRGCSKASMSDRLQQVDTFGVPVSFNYAGKNRIKSVPGAITTIVLGAILMAFAVQRFQELWYHSNPIISLARVQDAYDATHKLDLTANGFKIAFGVNDFRSFESLDSPEYVEWQVKLTTGVNQKQLSSTYLKYHKCTDEDYESFYEPRQSDKKFFEFARKNMGFFCIDDDQPAIVLWGQNNFEY